MKDSWHPKLFTLIKRKKLDILQKKIKNIHHLHTIRQFKCLQQELNYIPSGN